MGFASTNRTAVYIVKETVFGTTPTSPALTTIRYTGESINFNITNVVSEEIRSDRQTADLVQVAADTSGDINIELSYDAYDDFIIGALASTFNTTVAISSATDIGATVTTNIYDSSTTDFVAEGIEVGQWVKVLGFSDPANNGFHHVTVVAVSALTVAEDLVTEASGPSITMDGTMIRNGVDLHSWTIQKELQDPTTPTFINSVGVRVNTWSLSFVTGAILTGSFGLMGLNTAVTESQFGGATFPAAPTNVPMNAVSNILDIRIDDVTSTASFSNLTMNLSNALRGQDAIGTLGHVGIALSRLDLSGDITIYFEDKTMYDLYLNGTAFSLSFRADDGTNQYIFTFPKVKFETGTVVSGALDQDVLLEGTWRAIRDPVTDSMIQVDKIT